jgi:hypothetical protein
MQRTSSFASILATLLDEYDVPADQCEADVRALIGDMAERGLVTMQHEPR